MDRCWKCGGPSDAPDFARPFTIASTQPRLHTHLERFLSSNDAPPESEMPLICEIISIAQDEVDTLDARIEELQATLARLTRTRDAAAEHPGRHRAIVSPVRRVPPELLCEIFALVWATRMQDEQVQKPPWYLGQICRAWRRHALAYPYIWNTVIIPASQSPELLPAIETQLVRSAHAPLDLVFRDVQRDVEPPLLDVVLPLCGRWRSLSLQFNRSSPRGALKWLRRPKFHPDALERLELARAYGIEIADAFVVAPRLYQVLLTDWQFHDTSAPTLAVPWQQITHYRGTGGWSQQLALLDTIPNLVEGAMGLIYDDSGDTPSDPRVMPHIRRLRLERAQILTQITASSLEDLYIVSVWQAIPSIVLPFVQRSACS
ncbi:hypothetical protein B0H16DRAFT_967417 [Mycena metata]|uniref:F-box domain-containing protein n=1 Tax=Mycena metata TaxID=1033252 RepID=A0AAD7N4W2_9AGAR|nr:hypothetical protein B0H16DRAFT_967417 [Mycena metata]